MKRIIIVDDDIAIQDVYSLYLRRAGFEVDVYSNGQPLLLGNFITPDVFILDKQIPGADGIEVCKWLKQQDATREIPVIMLSASPQVAARAMQAGAVAFLEKPFMLSDLLDLLDRYSP